MIDGFSAPIRQSGVKPILMAGVARNYMVLNTLISIELLVILRMYELFFVPFVVHALGYYLYNRVDMDFFQVLHRYKDNPDYMDP